MNTLHITIGIPASGKSTWAKQMLDWCMVDHIICPDEIRGVISGNESDQTQNAKVFERAHNLLAKYMYDGDDVIFDATNLRAEYREPLLKIMQDFGGLPVAHIFDTPVGVCIARNNLRLRVVPEKVIHRMASEFSKIKATDLDDEGWKVVLHRSA